MLSSWFDVYLTIILTMIIALLVIGIIGNIIIITYFIGKVYKFQIKLASSYHFMTTQVALVDCCLYVCILIFLYAIRSFIKSANESAIPGHIIMAISTASYLIMLLLSYERYRTIVNLFKVALQKKYMCMACSFIWLQLFIFHFIWQTTLNKIVYFFSTPHASCSNHT